MRLNKGDRAPVLQFKTIHDKPVHIPDYDAKLVHIQFRRYAGCPICNLHLQDFIKRDAQIKAAGIHEVVMFHSLRENLLPYQGSFPFDVVGDPEKTIYKQFGVEKSLMAILSPKVIPTFIKALRQKDKPKGAPEGGPLGLPADFLISADGKIVASHYGSHASDQWSVDEMLKIASSIR